MASGTTNYLPYYTSSTTLSSTSSVYQSSENIGIGTIAPAARLHIEPSSTGIGIIASGSTTGDLVRLSQTGTGNVLVVEDSTNPDATPFVIQADGKIAIGTSSTVANLEVRGLGANGILLGPDLSGAVASSRLFFSNGIAGQHNAILNTTGHIDFRTDGTVNSSTGTNRMVIERTTGNVGIAQFNPQARLHVEPSSTGIGILATGSTSQDLVRITQTGTGNALVVEDATNPDSSQFVIDNAGNVGIGLSTPSAFPYKTYILSTNGGLFADSSTKVGVYGRTNAIGALGSGVEALAFGDSAGTYYGLKSSAYPSDTPTNGNKYIAGYFYADGLGEAAYSVRLQDGTQGVNKILTSINADGDANWKSDLILTSIVASASSTGDIVRITQTGTGNAFVVEDSANPDSTPFVVNASGNIGAGTASPSTKLHVFSTTSGAVRIVDGTQQAGYVLTSDANGVGTWQVSSGGSTLSGTVNHVPFYNTTTTLSSTSSIQVSGDSVGIGTAAGAAKLHISGSQSNPLIIASGSTTGDLMRITQTGAGNAFVVEDSANPDGTMFVINSLGNVGIGANPAAGRLYVQDSTNPAIYGYSTNGTGIVGVGTGVNAGVKGQGNIGIYGIAQSDTGTMIGAQGFAFEADAGSGTYIGGYFSAGSGGGTNYSIRLTDSTEGVDKILTSVTTEGHANWKSDIRVTSIIASASSTGDIVRITQTGTGNALVVEDSNNPDATPFVVTATGNVGIGATAPSTALHVSGAMKLTGTFSGNTNNSATSDAMVQAVLLYLSNNC